MDDADRSSVAFMRMAGDERIVCVCNFMPMTRELQAALPGAGTLRCLPDSDAPRFGGAAAERRVLRLHARPLNPYCF